MNRTIKITTEDELLKFINIVNTFDSHIDLYKGNRSADAKSILGVIGLGLYGEMNVNLISSDEDEMVRFNKECEQFV